LLLEPSREDDDPLLSVGDIARRLAVSTATVYGLCASGKLTHLRLLNIIRVRPADLRAFVNASVRREERGKR
jgi:excisionase family DNA binding protein